MKFIKSYKIFESKVDDKIQLLKDLSLDLQDEGLQVHIFNGKDWHLIRDPRVAIHTGSRYTNDLKNSIVMRITDDDEIFNSDLYYTDTIQEFIETLKSYGMNPRSMSGGRNFAVFKFDKWSRMTDSPYLKKINESKWGVVGSTQDIQHDYSIYHWFEDLKGMQWGHTAKNDLKKWSDHFIGRGYFDKISKKVEQMLESLDKVDIDLISDRMLEVWDELPIEKKKSITPCIAYGNYKNHDDRKYNGLIYSGNSKKDRKTDIIIHILKEIIYPTLFIGSPSIRIRISDEQFYVTDEKWNCENFDIENYDIEIDKEYNNGESGRRSTTTIYDWNLKELKRYSVDKVIDMYKPCLVFDIGGYDNSYLTGKIKLSHLEPLLDDVLESILPALDYEDVIWDKSRGKRQFDSDDFYDYTLKILLK